MMCTRADEGWVVGKKREKHTKVKVDENVNKRDDPRKRK